MSIRPATLVDLSAIVRLYQALTTEMAAIEPMIIQPLKTDNRDYLPNILWMTTPIFWSVKKKAK